MRLYIVLVVVLAGDANMRLYIVLVVVLAGDANMRLYIVLHQTFYTVASWPSWARARRRKVGTITASVSSMVLGSLSRRTIS
jgi:hypothetical protein